MADHKRLPDILETADCSEDVRIVLIPGLGPAGPPVTEWGLCSEQWQNSLADCTKSSVLCTIEHGVTVDSLFNFKRLVEAGVELQDQLIRLYRAEGDKHRPLVLVAHSLGGVILKQALSYLNVVAGQHTESKEALKHIAGVVFISTPHGLSDEDRLKENMSFLLNNARFGGLDKNAMSRISETFYYLIDIQKLFEETSFQFEMLSIFEKRPLDNKKATILGNKGLVIVDDRLAVINDEPCLAVDGDHFDICNLSSSEGLDQNVAEKLKDIVNGSVLRAREQAQAAVEAKGKAISGPSVDTDTTSVACNQKSEYFAREMGTVFKNLAPSQQQVQLPCFMMDPSFTKNRDFFGRASVLAELEKCLLPDFKGVPTAADQSNLSVVGMHGMPGVGKTEIAMQFVFTQRDKFDAVFWICADDETKLEADFCRIATELGLQSKNDQPNPTIMKNLVKEWLSRPRRILNGSEELAGPREPSWLIVFDNADNPSLLDGYLDTYGRGSILVTSRNPTVKDLRGVKSIALEPFTEEDASEFLDCLTNKAGGREDASRIANHLGGLPLAIAQMAGIIRNQFLTYSELLESFDDLNEQAELYGTWEGMVNKTARGDISSIWMINQLSPDARRLLEIISLLFPDQISDDLLHRKHPKSGSDDSCLVIPMSRPAFRKARAMLIHGSVIRRNEERKEIWIHRVPRQVVRSSLTADAKVAAFRCALKLVIAAWPKENFEKRHNKATVPEREKILPHVLSLRDFYKNEWLHDFYDVDFDMASILQKSAWLLYERGNLVRALPLAELARDIATKPGREECPELLSSIYDILGCIANGTNRPDKSMEYNTKLLELRERISAMTGVEDFPLAYAHNQKGCAMMMAAKYEEGRERFTDALRIWHAHPDFKPGIASMEYANLGLAHLLLGEPDKASDVLEKGLYEQEQGFGRDNPESFRPGRILHALGNVRVVQGRHEEAEVFHRRALNLYIAAVGPRYHRVADMCHKLAQHCIRHGDEESLRNGIKLADQALSIWTADREAYQPEIARTTYLKYRILSCLSRLRQRSGEINDPDSDEERRRLYKEAVGMYRDIAHSRDKTQTEIPEEEDFDDLVMFWSR